MMAIPKLICSIQRSESENEGCDEGGQKRGGWIWRGGGKKTEARQSLRLHTKRIVESYLPEQVQTALPHLAHVVTADPEQEARARAPTEARVSSSFVIVVGQWPLGWI
jgi:hypothetical protein